MPADPILTLAWLVLAHLVADFIVQTGAVVMAKNSPGTRGWLGLFAHGLGVGACLIPVALAFGMPGLWTLLAITIAHMLIDRTKILLTRRVERRAIAAADRRHEGQAPAAGLGRAWTPLPAAYFAADQATHIAVTFAAWAIWLSGQAPTAEWSTAIGNLFAGRDLAVVQDVTLWIVVIAALLIANVRGAALFVATLVRPTELGAEIGALAGTAGLSDETSHRCRRRPPSSVPVAAGTSGSGRSPAGSARSRSCLRLAAAVARRRRSAGRRACRPAAGPGRRDDRHPRAAPDRHVHAGRRRRGGRLRHRREDHRPVPPPRRPRLRRVLPARDARQRVGRDHDRPRGTSGAGRVTGDRRRLMFRDE